MEIDFNKKTPIEQLANIYIENKEKNKQIHIYTNSKFEEITTQSKYNNKKLKEKFLKKIFNFEYDEKIAVKTLRCALKAGLYFVVKQTKKYSLESLKETFSLDSLKKIDPSLVDPHLVSVEKLKALEKLLKTPLFVSRSEEGKDGVCFFTCKSSEETNKFYPLGKVVLKFIPKDKEYEWGSMIFCDHFLKNMGFITAQSKYFQIDSLPEKTIQKALNAMTMRKEETLKQLEECNKILVMKQLYATSFTDLEQENCNLLFKDEKFLHQLGEMIFFDEFICNDDRLSYMTCNLGNIMVDLETKQITLSTSTSNLVLIDQRFELQKKKESNFLLNKKTEELSKLLQGDLTKDRLQKLQTAFKERKQGYNESSIEISNETLNQAIPYIYKGIQSAAVGLHKTLKNEAHCRRLFQFPYRLLEMEVSRKVMHEIEKFIKKENK